jgi:6-phosphofructokinase 1
MEVMGRDAGWIALYGAVAAGADVCIIPEMPYRIEKIKEKKFKRLALRKGCQFLKKLLTYKKI